MSDNDRVSDKHQAKENNIAALNRVFLGGLNPEWTEEQVAKILGRFGKIIEISVARTSSGDSKGFAFVTFASATDAQASYGHHSFQGRSVESKPSLRPLRRKAEPGMKAADLRPSKLSKHSETFDQSTVRVTIISLADSAHASQSAIEITDSYQTSPKSKSRMEDKSLMSRQSKEFYPQSAGYGMDYYPSFGHPTVFATAPVHAFQAFSLLPFPAVPIKAGEGQAGYELPTPKASKGESHVRINFYTFPGRD